ncbi:uncharacterized protein L3040_002009 [Drepanopeziza brunnea f. sp. 'multigermtubi']|uniref:uncharacterized protein n=1 Tax=Drepanopeziza brunnea f. sp. 'multigermtubi' TaxID=698441 RepID=UPI00238A1654|nr:hypothetical protein L3040_002009 [Drepanopeziza brunnea f. sp. 'multigermtubi']
MGEDEEISPSQEIDFCTLGMFIIDEIHYLPQKPPMFNVLGGAGSYSALGARLFSPPPFARKVAWIVDKGSDFPPSLASQIKSWQTSCLVREDNTRLTTRGWNGYDEAQNRAFKYTTSKLRLTTDQLTPALLFSKSFHLICSPTRCIELVRTILRARKSINPNVEKPIFIWEPVPDLCLPTELLNCTNALPYIDICSPNANELAGFMSDTPLDPLTGDISKPWVERACEQLLGSMPLQSYALIIRCGATGCYIAQNGGTRKKPAAAPSQQHRPRNHARGGLTPETDMAALFVGLLDANNELIRPPEKDDGNEDADESLVDSGVEKWLPAYFTEGEGGGGSGRSGGSKRVVDPTGGGNGFLGGLAVGLARGKGLVEASAWGNVAASFMIEQVGVPVLGVDADGRETWNGCSVEKRLEEYMKSCESGEKSM